MARKCLISRRDWLQEDGVLLAGGLWKTALPLSNILDMRPQFVAETEGDGDSSTFFAVDLGAVRSVGVIFFAYLRVTPTTSMTVQAGNTSDFSVNLYDSGLVAAWPRDSDAVLYGEQEYLALGRPRFFVPDAPIDVRYLRVVVVNNAGSPMQIGCFGACETYELPNNYGPAPQITFLDGAGVNVVPFGSTYVNRRKIRRRMNFGFPVLTKEQMYNDMFEILLINGRSTPVVVVPFPDEIGYLEKSSIYGLVSHDNVISNPFFGHYAQPVQVDQLV